MGPSRRIRRGDATELEATGSRVWGSFQVKDGAELSCERFCMRESDVGGACACASWLRGNGVIHRGRRPVSSGGAEDSIGTRDIICPLFSDRIAQLHTLAH